MSFLWLVMLDKSSRHFEYEKNPHQNCNFCIENHVEGNWWCLTSCNSCDWRYTAPEAVTPVRPLFIFYIAGGGGGVLGTTVVQECATNRDVPQTWIAKSASWYINDLLFYAKFGMSEWVDFYKIFLFSLFHFSLFLWNWYMWCDQAKSVWSRSNSI